MSGRSTAAESKMSSLSLKQGPVTLYAQLATIFRDRIYTGIWREGETIPTLDKLTEEFGVARVTVRQAIQHLSDEGILSSHRGRRTHVTWKAPVGSSLPIFSSIGSLDESPSSYSVDVLGYDEFVELPPRLLERGKSKGPYVRIRKRDLYKGIPYTVSENFVRKDVYRRFPPGGETVSKIARLVKEAARPRPMKGFELIRVSMPSEDECLQLQSPSNSPVARVSRTFIDAKDVVLLYGNYVYRAKEFALLRDISEYFQE